MKTSVANIQYSVNVMDTTHVYVACILRSGFPDLCTDRSRGYDEAVHRAADTNVPGDHLNQTPGEGACVSQCLLALFLGRQLLAKLPTVCVCRRPC